MGEAFEAHMREAFIAWLDNPVEVIPFDIYARASDDFPRLKELNPSVIVLSAGGICPFQAEGYVKGLPFYFRSEEGTADLKVAVEKEDVHFKHLWASHEDLEPEDQDRGGHVAFHAFEEVLARMVQKLSKSPFLYEFEGWGNDTDEDGHLIVTREKRGKTVSWGHSPVEAELRLYEPDKWLAEKLNMTMESLQAFELQHEWTITNSDDRVWPEVDFTTS